MSGDSDAFLPPDPAALGARAETSGAAGGDEAAAALSRHHDALMARAGVVMVGETLDAVGRRAILIGVKTRRDLSRLPETIDGVPVVTQVIGEVDAQ